MTRQERIAKLKEMSKKNPQDSFYDYAIALELVEEDKYEEAMQLFVGLLEKNNDYLAAYYHYGALLEKLGNTTEAKNIYHQGIVLAKSKGDIKTMGELREALELVGDE